jgi:hypothetical protein
VGENKFTGGHSIQPSVEEEVFEDRSQRIGYTETSAAATVSQETKFQRTLVKRVSNGMD